MFGLFKKNPWDLVGNERLLLANSNLSGFHEFIKIGKGEYVIDPNSIHPLIKVIDENLIPYNLYYFKYIGNGEIIQAVKYTPEFLNQEGSKIAKLPTEMQARITDVNYQINSASPRWKKDELISLCFQLSDMRPRWFKS
jgi:hypothetical protein